MNKTKWQELQEAMYELNENSPKWRSKCITNEFISEWDGEWYYHFSEGDFKDLEWVEINIENEKQKELVLEKLKAILVPGHEVENGFIVYGYIREGQSVNYI